MMRPRKFETIQQRCCSIPRSLQTLLYYVLRTLFVLTDTSNSSATSPFLPSSTKIDDVYTRHAANELQLGQWSRGPALEEVIGSCSRQLCMLHL